MCREILLAAREQSALNFHCVSRIVDRAFKLGSKERSMFVKMMREYEGFSGLKVLSYTVMSNHIHLLVRVPKERKPGQEIDEPEFLRRLGVLYEPDHVELVAKTLKSYRKAGATKSASELKERYSYRMEDVSEFMKSLKQKFSRWYNKSHRRTGTLWEDRYSVTLVGDGWATKVTAAYIDLNPLRAGMVEDPANYRWSSYGEAVAGGKLAQSHLLEVMASTDPGASLGSEAPNNQKEALEQYRVLLAGEGQAADQDAPLGLGESSKKRRKRAKGFSKKKAQKILKQGGKLSLSQLLHCKARYFTAGFAIGSEVFVENVLDVIQQKTGKFKDRKSRASKIKHGEDQAALYSFRKLQKNPVQLE